MGGSGAHGAFINLVFATLLGSSAVGLLFVSEESERRAVDLKVEDGPRNIDSTIRPALV